MAFLPSFYSTKNEEHQSNHLFAIMLRATIDLWARVVHWMLQMISHRTCYDAVVRRPFDETEQEKPAAATASKKAAPPAEATDVAQDLYDCLRNGTERFEEEPLEHRVKKILHNAANLNVALRELRFGRRQRRMTVLHMAACLESCPLAVLRMLADACPKALLVQDVRGNTPLHLAIHAERSPLIVEYLIRRCPKAVCIPANVTISANDFDEASMVVLTGGLGDDFELPSSSQTHAVYSPLSPRMVPRVRTALNHSPPLDPRSIRTPLNLLCEKWFMFEALEPGFCARIFKILVRHYPDPKKRFVAGTLSLLHVACAEAMPSNAIKVLLDSEHQMTAFSLAAQNSAGLENDTPLHVVCLVHPDDDKDNIQNRMEAVALMANRHADWLRSRSTLTKQLPLACLCRSVVAQFKVGDHGRFEMKDIDRDLLLQTLKCLSNAYPLAWLLKHKGRATSTRTPLDMVDPLGDAIRDLAKSTTRSVLQALLDAFLNPHCRLTTALNERLLLATATTSDLQVGATTSTTSFQSAANLGHDDCPLMCCVMEDEVQAALQEEQNYSAVSGFFEMNRAGRSYMIEDPANRERAVPVLCSVGTCLDAMWWHLRENSSLFCGLHN